MSPRYVHKQAVDVAVESHNPDRPGSLENVYLATLLLVDAQDKQRRTIRAARKKGESLRDIATAARMSYETVRKICDSQKDV